MWCYVPSRSWGAFVWDQSGIRISGIMRVNVCLGAILIPECLDFYSGYSTPRIRIAGIYSYSGISQTNAPLLTIRKSRKKIKLVLRHFTPMCFWKVCRLRESRQIHFIFGFDVNCCFCCLLKPSVKHRSTVFILVPRAHDPFGLMVGSLDPSHRSKGSQALGTRIDSIETCSWRRVGTS